MSELKINDFYMENKGKPLCDRKLRELSSCEWIVFNLKCFATTVGRTFKWIGILISVMRHKGDNIEKIQHLRLKGGRVIEKIMQDFGTNRLLINAISSPRNTEEFERMKTGLSKITDNNTGISMGKIREILDKSKIDYDTEKVNDFEIRI